jgi:sugar/nucleoside kinase (ribokinase family)
MGGQGEPVEAASRGLGQTEKNTTKCQPTIAGAGICTLDHFFTAPQIPWGNGTYIERFLLQGGGMVGTAIVACARLGARCLLYTPLADDYMGGRILEELRAEGIDTSHVTVSAGGSSPFTLIHIDPGSGERTIFFRPGSGLNDLEKMYDFTAIDGCQVLLVDDIFPNIAIAAAREAHTHGIPVVGDLYTGPLNKELLNWVDILITSTWFAERIGCKDNLPRALQTIHELGPRTAIITRGTEGWVYSGPAGCGGGKAFPTQPIDTTGAGDAFHGAFAYGVASGWDLDKCGEFAAAVAAIKCSQPGGRSGLPSLDKVVTYLQQKGSAAWLDRWE